MPFPKREFCSLCGVILLDEETKNVCAVCEMKDLSKFENCPRCGRMIEASKIFCCAWCTDIVCDGCVYHEHEADDCTNPDDPVPTDVALIP